MLFTDEEARHEYHKAPTLLQVVCQVLEGRLAEASFQIEIMEARADGEFWAALIICGHPSTRVQTDCVEVIPEAVKFTNSQFKRSDGIETITLENIEAGIITVRVSDPHGFVLLN